MANAFQRLYRPELFQGEPILRRGGAGYFEGWYFKVASEDEGWAFIPGVSLAGADSHCFLQVNGPEGSAYHRYGLEEFGFGSEPFSIRVGPNRFSLEGLHVEAPGAAADIALRPDARWPSAPLAPTSMGWYAFAGFMECYHGIVVLDGAATGTVAGGRPRERRFYLEKDWGRSFPRGWVWLQSNSFAERASVTCSVAVVPFRGRSFAGFIIGLFAGGRLYRFATYDGARVESVDVGEHEVRIAARRGRLRLTITASRAEGAVLASPVDGAMEGRIRESMDATVSVRLQRDGRELFAGSGTQAGLEVVNPEALRPFIG